MSHYARQLAAINTDTTKAQNVDILTADFQLAREGTLCRITIAATNVAIRLTSNDEASDFTLGTSASVATYELALPVGVTWNLQTNDAAGVTVYRLVVQEVTA